MPVGDSQLKFSVGWFVHRGLVIGDLRATSPPTYYVVVYTRAEGLGYGVRRVQMARLAGHSALLSLRHVTIQTTAPRALFSHAPPSYLWASRGPSNSCAIHFFAVTPRHVNGKHIQCSGNGLLSAHSFRRGLSDRKDLPQQVTFRTSISSEKQKQLSQKDNSVVTQSLENAKERTKAVADKVRSSLPSLKTRHENIYNLPNLLTVSRLIAAPVTAYLVLHDYHRAALGVFAYAGITDLIDGWLARRWKLQTVAGSVMDPMADKALMIIVTVTLAIKGALPLYLATLILGRDASLAIAAIYYRYASLPAPKTFNRYWDFSLPSAEVHPTTVSKYNTFLQLVLIGSTLALPVITATAVGGTTIVHSLGLEHVDHHGAMQYFQWLVAGTTAWSGLSYAFLKNAVTIIGTNEELKAKQGARGRAIIGVTFGSVVAAAIWFAFTVDEERSRDVEDDAAASGEQITYNQKR